MSRTLKLLLLASLVVLIGLSFAAVVLLSSFSSSQSVGPSAASAPPSNANAPQSEPPDPTSQNRKTRIDTILDTMDWGNIAFNAPTHMSLESPSSIQLVLSPTDSIEELQELIIAEGKKEGAQIRISDQMEAHLSGTAFQISAITPERQAITWNVPTEWKWEIRPTQYGRHNLHLTLTAIINTDGSAAPRAIRTFNRTIEVEVSSWKRMFLLFRENWEWMWTLLALPIGAWWWKRRYGGKTSRSEVKAESEKVIEEKQSPEND